MRGEFRGGRPVVISSAPTNSYPNPDYLANGSLPTLPLPNSIFTTAVPASPVIAPNSATLVTNFTTQWHNYFDDVAFNYGSATQARYVVHGNSLSAWQKVSVNPNQRWSSGDPVGTILVPIPPNATPDQVGTDHQLIIWNLDNDPITGLPMFWELWGTDINNGWECNTMVRCPTDGSFNGVYPWTSEPTGLMTSAGAARISYAGGIVTVADALYGAINHALNFAMALTGSYVAPANQHDGTSNSTSVPEGTRFYFPSSVSMPTGLPVLAQMAFTAIKTYGIYIMDTSGAVNGYAEHRQPWINYQGSYYPSSLMGSLTYDVMNNLPWSQMLAITPMSAAAIVAGNTVPSAPTLSGSAGSAASGQITLNWTAPASSGSSSVSGYSLYYGTSSNVQLPTVQATTGSGTLTYTFTLTSGTTYYFKVAATSTVGTGAASNEFSITAP
jgi:hypothetical protein